jgi:energy-coupling factor transporter transmembrane protein EcfT
MKVPPIPKRPHRKRRVASYVQDLSEKRGLMHSINPLAKLVAIVGMIVASLFIANLTCCLLSALSAVLALTSRIRLGSSC